jgi:IrrE N-terminal-like domain
MSVNWEYFAGDTERFAVRVSLRPDPHDGIATEPALAASWGAIELWAGNRNLCAHIDQGETIQAVHWYLLPILEWTADVWDALFHEERLPLENAADDAALALARTRFAPPTASEADELRWEQRWFDWWSRHGLRAARDGGITPNLFIRRWRDSVELSWDSQRVPGGSERLSFMAPAGTLRLAPEEVAEPLFVATRACAEALASRSPGVAEFQALLARVDALSMPERRRLRVALLAGLAESVDRAQERWDHVVAALQRGSTNARAAVLELEQSEVVVRGSCHAALLFGAVAPTISGRDVETLANLLLAQYQAAGEPEALASLVDDVPVESWARPWEQGYSLAEDLHDRLGDDFAPYLGRRTGWVDVEALVAALNVDLTSVPLEDPQIRGVSIAGPQHRPTIATNPESVFGTASEVHRFTVAHELCHLLHDRIRGRKLAVASGPWAPRDVERRANAFAAYFLMPSHLVTRAVTESKHEISSIEGVEQVAQRLRVSRSALIEHLYNLNMVTIGDREVLRHAVGGVAAA